MKQRSVDLAVVGGGPAGLAAALEARRQGIGRVLLLERDRELGGILQQCIHDGFGLHRFGSRLSGPQYAQRFIREAGEAGIQVELDTMVLEITRDKVLYACSSREGMLEIRAGAVVLAMGCRERTQSQALICGARPAGVLTAGVVQRYINMEGFLPGREAVILGSGDIGLIMARRMTLEGIHVKGVYEAAPTPGGLTRNIVQCLEDYGIPLHLSSTVTAIHGRDRLHSVTVARVDENRSPIPGTLETIPCDLLVLAVGLIPENELSRGLELEMDPRTKGPVVDYVSLSGELAARGAAQYLREGPEAGGPRIPVRAGANVSLVVPQKISVHPGEQTLFLRVKEPRGNVKLVCRRGERVLAARRYPGVAPPEMLSCVIPAGSAGEAAGGEEIEVSVEGGEP